MYYDSPLAWAARVDHTETYIYPYVTNGTSVLTSVHETVPNGLYSWTSSFGRTNRTWTAYAGDGHRYVTNTTFDGSYTISYYLHGLVQLVTQYDADDNQLGATTYGYDAQGRQTTIADARNGNTTLLYNDAGLVVTNISPVPGTGQSAQVTSFLYTNVAGVNRLWKQVLPDGGVVENLYYPNGLLQRTWGRRQFPVEYAYDHQGRMTNMTTWKDYAGSSGAATTTWEYDAYRGFLQHKEYADGQGPSYTYTAGGRLATRTWARDDLTTTYTYDTGGTLTNVAYSDSTSPITYVPDRQGRPVSIVQGDTTITRVYNDVGDLLSESYTGGPLDGLGVTNSYDGWHRRSGLTLNAQPSTLSQSFSYDAASRLRVVSDGTVSAGYSYLANSPLVEQVYFTNGSTRVMTTTKSYDYLNRLTKIESLDTQPATLSSFSYALNAANQRTSVTNADGSFWIYTYDNLGQVTSGKKYWSDGTAVAGQQFEYGFDDIGNRTTTERNGREAEYSANNLNQYTERTVPGYVDILGTATNTATVTANLSPSERYGDYFRVEVPVDNASGPVWASIETLGVLQGTSSNNVDVIATNTGNALVAQAVENLYYDADGNLTGDSLWTNTWNAENRLVAIESANGVPTEGKKRETWTYLPDGRWMERVVSTWNGSAYAPSCDQPVCVGRTSVVGRFSITPTGWWPGSSAAWT